MSSRIIIFRLSLRWSRDSASFVKVPKLSNYFSLTFLKITRSRCENIGEIDFPCIDRGLQIIAINFFRLTNEFSIIYSSWSLNGEQSSSTGTKGTIKSQQFASQGTLISSYDFPVLILCLRKTNLASERDRHTMSMKFHGWNWRKRNELCICRFFTRQKLVLFFEVENL